MKLPIAMIACHRGSIAPSSAATPGNIRSAAVMASSTVIASTDSLVAPTSDSQLAPTRRSLLGPTSEVCLDRPAKSAWTDQRSLIRPTSEDRLDRPRQAQSDLLRDRCGIDLP